MNNNQECAFLNRICAKLRADRLEFKSPEWYIPIETENYAEIWIPTRGCTWDKQGFCTACNYGAPYEIDTKSMIHSVKTALSKLSIKPTTLLISSFSVLDEREIPKEARVEIFKLLSKTDIPNIICETRPETVSRSIIEECVDTLGDKKFHVEIGVESMGDFIRRWCFNKGVDKATIIDAINNIHDGGGHSLINLMVGAPFLSISEIVTDTVNSINEAIYIGADNIVLFPVHIKPNTLVKWLFDNDLYTPSSLWALIEVMRRLDNELLPRVTYAWIEKKEYPGMSETYAPTTCNKCIHLVKEHLYKYDRLKDSDSINWLFEYSCECRNRWKEDLHVIPELRLIDRLTDIFPFMGQKILGEDWWNKNGDRLLNELEQSWITNGHNNKRIP